MSTHQTTRYRFRPIWRRAFFKIKLQNAVNRLNDDILLYGTSSDLLDLNQNFKQNLEDLIWKKFNKKETFRFVKNEEEEPVPWYIIH